MTDFNFTLSDRIQKIQQINDKYNLLDNAYLSFSGGRDSTVLHYLLDIALPGNKIPRVFINTGIEYKKIVEFVKGMAKTDDRFVIVAPSRNIKETLEEFGYPFKSKEHSQRLKEWQNGCRGDYLKRYINGEKFISCPKKLKYQFEPDFNMKISDLCCNKMKKDPASKWSKENKRSVCITGMRAEEGGNRRTLNCIVTTKNDSLKKFHPLTVVNEEWMDEFIKANNVKLCDLYYEPFNFQRTGCVGCPFNKKLQESLDILKVLVPDEYKRANIIWKPVYDEYIRIGFRLKNIEKL
ncbi:MAG: phosphoadenosine phosphosulfate reductase family protein [Lachnospiraceae bacterium]|nr:phosphoadenosine phosphosulfate reductase family protein [Lachnospiraceae bacterium]